MLRVIGCATAQKAGWVLMMVCLLFAGSLAQAQPRGMRMALLIGNADYKHERHLNNPVNDAKLLGKVFKDDLKFDTVVVLPNLNLQQMDKAIADFIKLAENKQIDNVVFYFSGHGMVAENRENFLLPVSTHLGFEDALSLERQAISADEVRIKLKKLGARITLLILDACRDGPGLGKSGVKGLAVGGGGDGVLVAYATSEFKTAADGESANSPYAEALATALRNTDLPVLKQLDYVKATVRKKLPRQVPTRSGDLDTDAALLPEAAINDSPIVEEAAFRECQTSTTLVPCNVYLKDYPKGRYVKVAETKLAELRARAAVPPPAPIQAVTTNSLEPAKPPPNCDFCPEMVMIPAGQFQMGSNTGKSDERPVHTVKVGAFMLGKYEVTQGQWKAVMGTNPSSHKDCGDTCPVEYVGWNDAQAYVQKLNAKTGGKYRLPSEAEWEYAARAGGTGKWSFGDDETQLGKYAWYYEKSKENGKYTTHPVGLKEKNKFGLHDMHGNVLELVEDCYHDNYNGAPQDGNAWTKDCKEEAERVFRGGGWYGDAEITRSAYRTSLGQATQHINTGFRVALGPPAR